MGYGLLTGTDVGLIEFGLGLAMDRFKGPIRVVEIGVRDGSSSLGMKAFVESKGRQFDYSGFDNCRDMGVDEPWPAAREDPLRAKIYLGDSAETYRFAPQDIHFLLIDGCHCVNHVILDFLHFGDRVASKGLVAFHDMKPSSQGHEKDGQYQGHGPNLPDFGIAIREAHRLLGIDNGTGPNFRWNKLREQWDEGCWWGGVALFEKT